jgi:hypothetical protein
MSTRAVAHDGRRLKSSGGKDTLLPRVRAVLQYLQHTGHPDLLLADVPRITNYWMGITGASEATFRKVLEYLRNGQGRWRLLAKEPTQMAQKYIQSTLTLELLSYSSYDRLYRFCTSILNTLLLRYLGWWLFWD